MQNRIALISECDAAIVRWEKSVAPQCRAAVNAFAGIGQQHHEAWQILRFAAKAVRDP